MSVKNDILVVGFDKKGQADFRVRLEIIDLTYEQMNELRAKITVAIGVMEWMRLSNVSRIELPNVPHETTTKNGLTD